MIEDYGHKMFRLWYENEYCKRKAGTMSKKWSPEEIKAYSKCIKKAEKQKEEKVKQHDKWLEDFINSGEKGGNDDN